MSLHILNIIFTLNIKKQNFIISLFNIFFNLLFLKFLLFKIKFSSTLIKHKINYCFYNHRKNTTTCEDLLLKTSYKPVNLDIHVSVHTGYFVTVPRMSLKWKYS